MASHQPYMAVWVSKSALLAVYIRGWAAGSNLGGGGEGALGGQPEMKREVKPRFGNKARSHRQENPEPRSLRCADKVPALYGPSWT